MTAIAAPDIGAKKRDYWWTVLAVDPIAIPLARTIARKKWLTPDQVTWISLLFGLPMAAAYGTGERWGLAWGPRSGTSRSFSTVSTARWRGRRGSTSPKGAILDELADGARRASGALGLTIYLYRVEDGNVFFLGVVYGLLAFLFGQISGGTRPEPKTKVGSRWSEWLARKRLMPTPGAPDVAALAFFFGPLTGLVVPSLIVADSAFALAILLIMLRLMKR